MSAGDFEAQLQQMKKRPGFIAALDQSGGSTPGALRAYGIKEGAWSNDEEMFALVHQMRTRVMTSPSMKITPIAACHGSPRPRMSSKATTAFKPRPDARANG